MGGLRHNRIAHTGRPTALVSAVATLLAALFICTGGRADTRTGGDLEHAGAHPGVTAASTVPVGAEYTCPYDRGDCGLATHLSPAVLTAPPPAGAVDSAAPPSSPAPPLHVGRASRTGALPRAPDLHVLQVLRT
ncbi:hypothetical protein [Streptomyces sp. NPDC002133]|uniref:hypothetical protein n=1 Tax=Streptomyces sp. NPDC002133 TaxID=3154409 RepID=UPI00331803F1